MGPVCLLFKTQIQIQQIKKAKHGWFVVFCVNFWFWGIGIKWDLTASMNRSYCTGWVAGVNLLEP